MTASSATSGTIRTDIPARLDRLPWCRWHVLVLVGLGSVWILDGLGVTIVGALGDRLTEKGSGLALTDSDIGMAAAIYVLGACLGALFFGDLTERYGRKRLFMVTLGLYLAATVATAFSTTAIFFFACRFFTGAGIGGEYSAINSAIDELMPARLRGRLDLMINGSFWLGSAAGSALTLVLLDKSIFPADIGWRLAFGLGAVLGLLVLVVRRNVPESPRWLSIHGRHEAAEEIIGDVEDAVERDVGTDSLPAVTEEPITIHQREPVTIREIAQVMVRDQRSRSMLGLSLFVGQAFLYNAVFFTQGLVLTKFFDVGSGKAGIYLIPLAIGNFLGPLLLGKYFDTVGRRKMITLSYVVSGTGLLVTAWLAAAGAFDANTLTAAWSAVFFFASAGASAAYLTVSEIFPMETRAMAIAVFYAVGTGLGGIIGPLLFGRLIDSGKIGAVAVGYVIGAALMIAAGAVEWWIGVDAEGKRLEDIASPLSAAKPAEPAAA